MASNNRLNAETRRYKNQLELNMIITIALRINVARELPTDSSVTKIDSREVIQLSAWDKHHRTVFFARMFKNNRVREERIHEILQIDNDVINASFGRSHNFCRYLIAGLVQIR